MQKKAIVVFGGSFNPPIYSHFSLAQQIIDKYEEVEKVIFVPVNTLYNKQGLVDNEHRYNMLNLACSKNSNFLVSRIELDNKRQLYTIETLTKIKEEYKDYNIWFAIGTDNLKELNTWKRPKELIEKFKVLILERAEDKMDEIIENDEFLREHRNLFTRVENSIRTNMSSTFIRDKIKKGECIKYLTLDEIYEYIEENNLYKN